MTKINLLRTIFWVLLAIAVIHTLSIFLLLYSFYWWLDIVPHFLGGFCVGLFSVWLFMGATGSYDFLSRNKVIIVTVLGALVFGLLWEIFEYFIGATFNTIGSYPLDIIKDLIVDVAGGYFASVYFRMNTKI